MYPFRSSGKQNPRWNEIQGRWIRENTCEKKWAGYWDSLRQLTNQDPDLILIEGGKEGRNGGREGGRKEGKRKGGREGGKSENRLSGRKESRWKRTNLDQCVALMQVGQGNRSILEQTHHQRSPVSPENRKMEQPQCKCSEEFHSTEAGTLLQRIWESHPHVAAGREARSERYVFIMMKTTWIDRINLLGS